MLNPNNNNPFLAYYTPSKATQSALVALNKAKEEAAGEEGGEDVQMEEADGTTSQYDFVRDYKFTLQQEKVNKKVFFLLKPKSGAFYNQLNEKLVLTRKRAKVCGLY